ncbi:MAG: hypothetical protein DRJ07_03980 [Bacteroidetes bacterium]|nr:MAG: hypothetical protein DRJ07_03980 [Bacteroidota bacterium]
MSVLIALMISAFIALTYMQNHFRVKVALFKSAVQYSNFGINYANKSEISYLDKTEIELDEKTNVQISMRKMNWGLFDLIYSRSTIVEETFQKSALVGGFQQNRNALYLQDINRPLVVVGNTEIVGRTALPKNGVKRGSIAGHSYIGSQLIYGTIVESKTDLPKIRNVDFMKNFSRDLMLKDSIEFIELIEDYKLFNSFNDPTKVHSSNNVVRLNFIQLTGNIIVQSDTLIIVENTSKLKDIILVAPNIEIANNFNGNFQAIASKNIVIGQNCDLRYPSALILTDNESNSSIKKNKVTKRIQINSNSIIRGIICHLSNDIQTTYGPRIILEENSKIIGEIYSEENIELKGTVDGMVYTKGFVARQFGSVYQNHIYNGKIIEENLPKQYVGLQFENVPNSVAKWMY